VNEIVTLTGLAQSNVSNHLARFRQREWVETERSGRQISYRISDPALRAYIEQHPSAGISLLDGERARMLQRAGEEYLSAAVRAREDLAERVIDDVLDAGAEWREVYLHVFLPALRQIGELWQRGELSVAAEHAATAFTERLMSRLTSRLLPDAPAEAATLVIGCVAGEHHAVGARMAADFFRASGWRVRYLGADVPVEEFLAFVRSVRPDVVAVSATLDASERALRRTVAELCGLESEVRGPILIGGGQWFDRHADHGLALDLCGNDLPAVVAEATHLLQTKGPSAGRA
jgi:methanogenic corrinoid protein MtbC1